MFLVLGKFLIFIFIFFPLFSLTAEEAPSIIGEYRYWTSLKYKENKKLVCFMSSSPIKVINKPKNVRRGDIYMLVTHRTATKVRDEVSIYFGYPLKKGSKVNISIDGKKYKMFTKDSTAWASDSRTDRSIVQSMRSGDKLVVNGVSSKGTKTKDTYSLSGFTASHKAISKACRK